MGIYIKGMQMPENCVKCMFGEEDEEWGSVCRFTAVPCLSIGRQDTCPLTPVSDHGRLIEAERLKKVFHRNVVGGDAFDQLIDIAPTVIPGDREGEA